MFVGWTAIDNRLQHDTVAVSLARRLWFHHRHQRYPELQVANCIQHCASNYRFLRQPCRTLILASQRHKCSIFRLATLMTEHIADNPRTKASRCFGLGGIRRR